MKKFVKLITSLLVVFVLVACGNSGNDTELTEDHTMYLITDVGTIDDKSFNQGSYEGMAQYAHEIGVTPNYIAPEEQSDEAYLDAINRAVEAGAEVIVTPGFYFENAIATAQAQYPEVKFILVDAVPAGGAASNTLSILYKEEQSGFLAGYAAVKDGHTDLGFMGGAAVPAVIRFGYGYLAGADYAAAELDKTVNVRFTYLNTFGPDAKIVTQAESWFRDGVSVIFASAGGAGNSVMKAAEDTDNVMIGVDVDQSGESDSVLTSAMKNLKGSVYEAVKAAKEGNFPGGETWNLGAVENGISLPEGFDRFESFTKADYDAIYKVLVDDVDGIASSIPTLDSHGGDESVIEFDNITVESIGERGES